MALDRNDSKTAIPQLEARLSEVENVGKKGLANFDILQDLIQKEILERERQILKTDTSINTITVKMYYLLCETGVTPTPETQGWSETMPKMDSTNDDKVLWYMSKTFRNGSVVKTSTPQMVQIMDGVFAFINSVSGDNDWTTIDGGTIATGRIQDHTGDNYFDLDDGTFNFGDQNGNYVRQIGDGLEIYGTISANSTVGGKSMSQLVDEIEGNVNTWFYAYVPTLSNAPASTWSAAEKDTHLGDLFYNTSTGKAYRFMKSGNVYSWELVTDTDITTALSRATSAYKRTQKIYRRQSAAGTPTAPTTWVTTNTNVYDQWTTKVPPLAQDTASGRQKYPYLYTCEQFQKTDDSDPFCSTVLLDENTTVIDGGQIITGSVTANEVAANSIGAKHLAISDTTNLAVANEMYEASLPTNVPSTSIPAISGGYLVKKTATQQYLMVCDYPSNTFVKDDELYYEFYGKAATAGSITLGAWNYTGTPPTHTFNGSNTANHSLTTTEAFYSGTLKLSDTSWNTATHYILGFSDGRTTKSQIYIRKLIIRRKNGGELIVDGSITAGKIASGSITIGKIDTSDTSTSEGLLNNSIQLGGRNLLAGTQHMVAGTGTFAQMTFRASGGTLSNVTNILDIPSNNFMTAIRSTNSSDSASQVGFCQDQVPIYIPSGTQITISFWCRASVANLTIRTQAVWYNASSCGTTVETSKTTTDWKYVTHTATLNTDISTTCSAGYIYAKNVPVNGWFDVAGVKLEVGNKATEWTDDIPVSGINLFGSGDCTTSLDGITQTTNKFSLATDGGLKCAKLTGVKGSSGATGYLNSGSTYIPQKNQFVSMSCDMKLENYSAGTTNPYVCMYFAGAQATDGSGWIGARWLYQTFNGKKECSNSGNIATYINNKGWVHIEATAVWYKDYNTEIPCGQIYGRDFTGTLYVRNVKFEIGHKCTPWSPYPPNAKVTDAAKTATSYVTKIDDAGIFISPSNQSPTTSSAGNSVKIDGNGMEVYSGGDSIASFGSSVQIGSALGEHMKLSQNKFALDSGGGENFIIRQNTLDFGEDNGGVYINGSNWSSDTISIYPPRATSPTISPELTFNNGGGLNLIGNSPKIYMGGAPLFQSGHETFSSISTNSYATKTITFGSAFNSAPNVVACLSTSGTAGNIGNVSVSVFDITKTNFKVRVFNNRGSAIEPAVEWIAVKM